MSRRSSGGGGPSSIRHRWVSRGSATTRSYMCTSRPRHGVSSSSRAKSASAPRHQPGAWSTQAPSASSRRRGPVNRWSTSTAPPSSSDGCQARSGPVTAPTVRREVRGKWTESAPGDGVRTARDTRRRRMATATAPKVDLLGITLAHRMMRRDLHRLTTPPGGSPAAPPARRSGRAAIAAWVRDLCTEIHHHTAEDDVAWPLIAEHAGAAVDLTALSDDHGALDPLLDAVGDVEPD